MESHQKERGIKLFEIGKYNKAIKYFKDTLAHNPDDFEAKYYLAYSLLMIKDFKTSESLSYELLKYNANNEHIIFLLAKVKYFSKKIEEAKELVNKAISINPNEADFFGIKAYIFIAEKQYKNAIKTAKEGLKIDSENQLCLNALINETGKLKIENRIEISSLLRLEPENAFSQANIGFSELRKHNYENAKQHFKTALTLDPNLKLAKDGLLAYYKLKGKHLYYLLGIPLIIKKFSAANPLNFIFGFFVFALIFYQLYSYENFSFLCVPFTVFYLYLVFGSWLFKPFSNLKILFSTHRNYLLERSQILSGFTFLVLLILSFGSLLTFYIRNSYLFLILSFSLICISVFVSNGILNKREKSKIFSFSLSILHFLICILLFLFPNQSLWFGIIIFVTFVVYTRNLDDTN